MTSLLEMAGHLLIVVMYEIVMKSQSYQELMCAASKISLLIHIHIHYTYWSGGTIK